jgi:hypothetical protein
MRDWFFRRGVEMFVERAHRETFTHFISATYTLCLIIEARLNPKESVDRNGNPVTPI